MIDLVHENVVSLNEASKLSILPRRRAGRRPHTSTLYRWARRGFAGVKLETIRVGGTLCTSVEALQRFAERLSAADPRASAPIAVTPARRRREIARAEEALEEEGIR